MKKQLDCATEFEIYKARINVLMSRILIEEENPYRNIGAFVEDDGRTIYLYRVPSEESTIEPSAVWVRNLQPAPTEADDAPLDGVAPLMTAESCAHPEGLPSFDPADLDLIWFPDGTGVTLYVNGEVEAILPPWAGHDFVHGYAKEAVAYSQSTIPLPRAKSELYNRLKDNQEFWNRRTSANDWSNYRDSMIEWYESFLGKHSQYYAVEQSVPMLGVIQFNNPKCEIATPKSTSAGNPSVFVTIGMGRQPQPGIEMYHENPDSVLHTEVLCYFPNATQQTASILGRIAAYPWKTGRFFDDSHIYESGYTDQVSDFFFTANHSNAGWPEIPTAPLLDDRYTIRPLFAVPVSQDDILVARSKSVEYRLKRLF